MADDVGMVERTFGRAGLGATAASRAELAAYMESHERGARGRVVFSMGRDFGVDVAAVRERFSFYTDLHAIDRDRGAMSVVPDHRDRGRQGDHPRSSATPSPRREAAPERGKKHAGRAKSV